MANPDSWLGIEGGWSECFNQIMVLERRLKEA